LGFELRDDGVWATWWAICDGTIATSCGKRAEAGSSGEIDFWLRRNRWTTQPSPTGDNSYVLCPDCTKLDGEDHTTMIERGWM
jgi:hypothetical protein